jgi:outer membrane murein-binding lipoprotein Lpp
VTEPTSDAERIDWLWTRVEQLAAENASLTVALQQVEALADAATADAAQARESITTMSRELMSMATELNAARAAAANSVRDHMAASRT